MDYLISTAYAHGLGFNEVAGSSGYTAVEAFTSPAMLLFMAGAFGIAVLLYRFVMRTRFLNAPVFGVPRDKSSYMSLARWFPIFYLLVIAGFHFDGWYHGIVGRDQFWIPPHIIIALFQGAHTILAFVVARLHFAEESPRRAARMYLFIQLLFWLGFVFDEFWHRIIGQETIDTALVFWGPPHLVIAASLLATPFLLIRLFRAFDETPHVFFSITACGTLFAFVHFYFQPFWPLGPFRVIGVYGEVVMLAILGFVLFWGIKKIEKAVFPAVFITLSALSIIEIMSWGAFADIPRESPGFGGVIAYPYWLSFFSFLFAALALDGLGYRLRRRPEVLGVLWGGVQALVYYIGAKMWTDLSPYSLFPTWQYFPGIQTSWAVVLFIVSLGMLGGAVGFLAANFLYKRTGE